MARTAGFWERCRQALPEEGLGDRYTVRRMGNTPALCETLLELVRTGEKTGTFSRPQDLAAEGLTPNPGDFVVFTDFAGEPRCLVRMEECRLMRFGDVGPAEAACESPAARDIEAWRGIHGRYWTKVLAAEGGTFSDDLEILFQRFRLLRYETP
jgi:uncharacterized protein YhfF